jgi:NTE family protein
VDGGITDNLGLRALIDIIAISGNPKNLSKNWRPPKHLVVIAVDAATQLETEMDESNKNPSSVKVASAVTKLQLTRYDADSMLLIRQLLEKWSAKLSTPEQPVATYLISVDIKAVEDPSTLEYLNSIPTSFNLDDEQVDKLIAAGRQLLKSNPEYQALLSALGGQ